MFVNRLYLILNLYEVTSNEMVKKINFENNFRIEHFYYTNLLLYHHHNIYEKVFKKGAYVILYHP